MINKTKKEKLGSVKQKFTDSWFEGLKKSWKDDYNKRRLKESYNITSKLTLDVVFEEIEKIKDLINTRMKIYPNTLNADLLSELKIILEKIKDLEKIDINGK